jgi:hypothetical protein
MNHTVNSRSLEEIYAEQGRSVLDVEKEIEKECQLLNLSREEFFRILSNKGKK